MRYSLLPHSSEPMKNERETQEYGLRGELYFTTVQFTTSIYTRLYSEKEIRRVVDTKNAHTTVIEAYEVVAENNGKIKITKVDDLTSLL